MYKLLYFLLKKRIKNLGDKFSENKFSTSISEVRSKGITKLKNFYKEENLDKVKTQFEYLLQNDFKSFFYEKHPDSKINIDNDNIDFDKIKNYTNYVMLKNHLVSIPEIFNLINDDLTNFLKNYFGTIPSLTHVNLKRSFFNNLSPMGQNFYHRDENSINFQSIYLFK